MGSQGLAPARPSRRRFFFELQRKEKTAAGLKKR